MGLGIKNIGKKLKKFGQKVAESTNNLGKKTMNVIDNVDRGIDKGLTIADHIADVSGGVTNAIRKGTAIADKIIKGVEASGIANTVPWGPQAIAGASRLSGALKQGAEKVDHIRDKYAEARDTIKLEKPNIRKKLEDAARKMDEMENGYA